MTEPILTWENHNLGDSLVYLHLARALAKQNSHLKFIHFCHAHHIPQLQEVVQDIPAIQLMPFESDLWAKRHTKAICVWKNHVDEWVNSPLRWDWSGYTLWHHQQTARRMGLESPFTCREHLLFDWPGLEAKTDVDVFDFFICNSEPNSGQFGPMQKHGSGYLDELILALQKNHRVITAKEVPGVPCVEGSITSIGSLSVNCRHHIMIATGPMWPTLNTTNHHHHEGRKRIVLLDNGEILGMPHITQCANADEVMEIAKQEGWLT